MHEENRRALSIVTSIRPRSNKDPSSWESFFFPPLPIFHHQIAFVQMITCVDSAKIICVKECKEPLGWIELIQFLSLKETVWGSWSSSRPELFPMLHSTRFSTQGFQIRLQIEWWFTFAARTYNPSRQLLLLSGKTTTNGKPQWQMNCKWWDFACIVAPELHACRCNNHLSSDESILMHSWRARPRSKMIPVDHWEHTRYR